MGIELQSETRMLIGRLCAPSDPARPWWWQSSTIVDGAEMIVAGLAPTEHEAILEAAASTIDLRWHDEIPAAPTSPGDADRQHDPGWWPGIDDPG